MTCFCSRGQGAEDKFLQVLRRTRPAYPRGRARQGDARLSKSLRQPFARKTGGGSEALFGWTQHSDGKGQASCALTFIVHAGLFSTSDLCGSCHMPALCMDARWRAMHSHPLKGVLVANHDRLGTCFRMCNVFALRIKTRGCFLDQKRSHAQASEPVFRDIKTRRR